MDIPQKLPDTGRDGLDGHLLALHRSERERRHLFLAWTARGLRSGEQVILSDATMQATSLLEQRGFDIDGAVADGQLLVVSPDVPLPDRLAMVDRALDRGYPGVRMTARTEEKLVAMSEDDLLSAESAFEDAVRELPLSVLCPCDVPRTPSERVAEVVDLHRGRLRERQLVTEVGDGIIVLEGDIDLSNAALCSAAIRAAADACEAGVLHIDLSRLRVLGVAACRSLIEGTEAFRSRGGDVVLVAPREVPEMVLRSMDIPRLMRIDEARPPT